MKYLFSDYYFLCGAADKETRTVGDAYRRMCAYLNGFSTCDCLLHALRGLVAGGYITVEPEGQSINLGSPISVTKSGREAVAISGLQKLFGVRKAFLKNQLRFCSMERPDDPIGGDWWVDSDCLERINLDGVRNDQWAMPLCMLGKVGDDTLSLALYHSSYAYGQEDTDPDAPEQENRVAVTGSTDRIMQGISDLLEAAHALLTEPPRTRKVALHGADKSLVVTLAQAASEQGTVLRVTVNQIRFNRQRFYGKRDGDLDYAQCGDPLMTLELYSASDFATLVLPCLVAMPGLLSCKDLENIEALHKLLK